MYKNLLILYCVLFPKEKEKKPNRGIIMDVIEIWEHALSYIRQDINSVVGYNTYIKDARPISYENDVFKVAVSTAIIKNMIMLRYCKNIETSISKITAQPTQLEIVVQSEDEQIIQEPVHINNTNAINLNPRYTFANFVVGSSNEYATAVAKRVADYPGQMDNPLFLYGKSGLGKTHLMQAIGNEISKKAPDLKVLYVTSERFTNDMINSLRDRDNNMETFRHRYREVDVLLIDDVQFIEGKEGTQEEFFHTFNDLYQNNKQIVLTSDRKPKDLITLEERLRTRFEWGITIDISIPDYETRMAILQKKAESQNANIPEDILSFIAERIDSNIRELEGALLKIISLAGISHKKIDIPLAEEALRSILPDEGIIKITPDKIIERVSTYYNITKEEIMGQSKMKNIVVPRQIAMYLCKTMTDMNFVMIARALGNKDRTTIMHGVDKIMILIDKNPALKADIDYIIKDLNSL